MDNEYSAIIDNATLGCDSRHPALLNISLKLKTSSVYGLFGENGSGKTTLLNSLTGGLQSVSGAVEVLGYKMPCRHKTLLQQLFYVPQYPAAVPLAVFDFAHCYAPFYPQFNQEEFYENIRQMKIATHRRMSGMSPGEIKKIVLAFAFAAHTPILLLDEPTNTLDIGGKKTFQTLLAQTDVSRRSIIVSSHSASEIENLITDAIILHDRHIAIDMPVSEIADRFSFTLSAGADPENDILYSDGLKSICRNTSGMYSDPDIELLYTAIHQNEYFRNIISSHETPDNTVL